MESSQSQLTVLFQDGMWIGYFEYVAATGYQAARHVFGPEPGEAEIREFILSAAYGRLRWTEAVPDGPPPRPRENPKRRSREVAEIVRGRPVTSKAQTALKTDLEDRKREGKTRRRQERAGSVEDMFRARQEKRREKRRGH